MAFRHLEQPGRATHGQIQALTTPARWMALAGERIGLFGEMKTSKRHVPDPLRVVCSFLAEESVEFGRCGSPKWKTSRVRPRARVDV